MSGENSSGRGKIYRRMDSAVDARAALLEVLGSATRELAVFDHSAVALRERGFGSPATADALRRILISGRQHRVRLVLHSTSAIETELPRVILLLRQFGAQLAIHRSIGAARDAQDVLVVADDLAVWRKPVATHPRSILEIGDAVAVKPYLERFEEIWEASELAVMDGAVGL